MKKFRGGLRNGRWLDRWRTTMALGLRDLDHIMSSAGSDLLGIRQEGKAVGEGLWSTKLW
jgi:hypothetical protein